MKLPTKKIIGIYQVTNRINGKSYIGKSFNIYARWRQHLNSLESPREKNLVFHRALRKYGEDNFDWNIIVQVGTKDDHLLSVLERFFIAEFHTWVHDKSGWGYNETPGGEGHPGERSDEFKQKIRNSWAERRKIVVSEETRRKMGDAHRGRKYSCDHTAKVNAGKARWNDPDIRSQTIATRKTNVIKNRGLGLRISYSTFDGVEEYYFSSVKEAAKYFGIAPDGFNNILTGKVKRASYMSDFLQSATIQWVPADVVFANRSDLDTI